MINSTWHSCNCPTECPHVYLNKKYVGSGSESMTYHECACGQKFKMVPWDGKVQVKEAKDAQS